MLQYLAYGDRMLPYSIQQCVLYIIYTSMVCCKQNLYIDRWIQFVRAAGGQWNNASF